MTPTRWSKHLSTELHLFFNLYKPHDTREALFVRLEDHKRPRVFAISSILLENCRQLRSQEPNTSSDQAILFTYTLKALCLFRVEQALLFSFLRFPLNGDHVGDYAVRPNLPHFIG